MNGSAFLSSVHVMMSEMVRDVVALLEEATSFRVADDRGNFYDCSHQRHNQRKWSVQAVACSDRGDTPADRRRILHEEVGRCIQTLTQHCTASHTLLRSPHSSPTDRMRMSCSRHHRRQAPRVSCSQWSTLTMQWTLSVWVSADGQEGRLWGIEGIGERGSWGRRAPTYASLLAALMGWSPFW